MIIALFMFIRELKSDIFCFCSKFQKSVTLWHITFWHASFRTNFPKIFYTFFRISRILRKSFSENVSFFRTRLYMTVDNKTSLFCDPFLTNSQLLKITKTIQAQKPLRILCDRYRGGPNEIGVFFLFRSI